MKIAILVLVSCVSLSLFGTTLPSERSDSGIHGPRYSEILQKINNWNVSYPTLTEVIDYGKSVEGRTLRMVVMMKKKIRQEERPALVMTGSTHGDEYLNIEDRIPEVLLERSRESGSTVNDFLNLGGAVVFVPILNPDGYDQRKRENANGVDLNRDWDVPAAKFKGFKQVESRLLAAQLEKLTKPPYNFRYRVTVDYHCCIGALLYPWAFTDISIPKTEEDKHIAIGNMATHYLNTEVGTSGKILGYNSVGTTKDHYYDRYKALAFTYEGKFEEENKSLKQHVSWWEEMLKSFSNSTHLPIFSIFKQRPHAFIKIAD